MFFVRIYHISCPCKNTCKKRMIKVLFIIMVADSPSQQHIHLFGKVLAVTIPHGMKQRTPVTFFRAVIEPFDNSRFKDFLDFSVWDHKRYCTIRQLTIIIFFACFCQIAGKIQHTPKILLWRMQIIISQVLIHALNNRTSSQQSFQFPGDIASSIINEWADNCIITRILPIADRLCLRIAL